MEVWLLVWHNAGDAGRGGRGRRPLDNLAATAADIICLILVYWGAEKWKGEERSIKFADGDAEMPVKFIQTG